MIYGLIVIAIIFLFIIFIRIKLNEEIKVVKLWRRFGLSWFQVVKRYKQEIIQHKRHRVFYGELLTGTETPDHKTIEIWATNPNTYTITISTPIMLFEKVFNCSSQGEVENKLSEFSLPRKEYERLILDMYQFKRRFNPPVFF